MPRYARVLIPPDISRVIASLLHACTAIPRDLFGADPEVDDELSLTLVQIDRVLAIDVFAFAGRTLMEDLARIDSGERLLGQRRVCGAVAGSRRAFPRLWRPIITNSDDTHLEHSVE